jgi:hypothetical protein
MSCSDFRTRIRESLQDLPLEQWPDNDWLSREKDKFLSFQHSVDPPASLYLAVADESCHLKASWYHASGNPKPTAENREMFFRVMGELQKAFGKDAVRVTRRGRYFDT